MPIELITALVVAGIGFFGWLSLTIYNNVIGRIEIVERSSAETAPQQAVDNERWLRQDKINEQVNTLQS